jgi:hypothetical protein
MKPTIKPKQGITIHRDLTISYFSVYNQVWDRTSCYNLTTRHDDFNALSQEDRERISKKVRSYFPHG